MSRARTYSTISALLVALFPFFARAESAVETVSLDYETIAGCPAARAFSDEVRARTHKAVFSRSARGRRFVVRLERTDDTIVGRLEIVEPEGETSERRIDGEQCADVVSALALAAALAIDPEASTAPRADLPSPQPAPAARPSAPPPPTRAPPRVEPGARWALAVGLSAGAVRGPATETLFAAGPSVEVFRDGTGWRPALRVTLLGAQTGLIGPSAELATFRWAAARTELCPHRLGVGSALALRACALADAGVLYARGDAAEEPGSATRAWLALGLGLGLDVEVSDWISLSFSIGESLNLTRDDFVFLETPKRRVHQVPIATQTLLVGAAFRLL